MKWSLVLLCIFLFIFAVSAQEIMKDRVNVKFKSLPTEETVSQICEQFKLEKLSEVPELQVIIFKIGEGNTVRKVIRELQALPEVEFAEPEYVYQLDKSGGNTTVSGKSEVSPDTAEYVAGEVLIKFKAIQLAEQQRALARRAGLQVLDQIPELNVQRCRIVKEASTRQIVQELAGIPEIEYSEPNYIVRALESPNDPDFGKLWGLNNEGQTGGNFDADIDAPEAWDKQKGSKNVLVSIIDTGIEYTHPDLAANMWVNPGEIPNNNLDDDQNGYVDDYRGWDFINNDNDPIDDNDHGTHCAGTVGAVGDNNRGVVGVNWHVSLMPVKFLNQDGSGTTSDAAKSIIYAANNGANILSNSWGGEGRSQTLEDAIAYASGKGVLFIAAAGNSSNDNDVKPHYPSSYTVENVIAVAATDDRDLMADFSNYGATSVDLGAPGVEVYSTVTQNRYKYLSGTSMATPHVAGAAALVWAQYFARADREFVKYRLFGAVDYVRKLEGWVLLDGRLNVNNALSERPLISVLEKPGDTSDVTGPYPVVASVVDDDTLTAVNFSFRITGDSVTADTLQMAPQKEWIYRSNIPGAPMGSKIEYKILAEDNNGNITETRFYSFQINGSSKTGCCGSFAATVQTPDRQHSIAATLFLNLLLFFGPPVYLKMRFRRRQRKF